LLLNIRCGNTFAGGNSFVTGGNGLADDSTIRLKNKQNSNANAQS